MLSGRDVNGPEAYGSLRLTMKLFSLHLSFNIFEIQSF